MRDETIVFSANSMEELLDKIDAYNQNRLMNETRTLEEQMLGTHIDFRG